MVKQLKLMFVIMLFMIGSLQAIMAGSLSKSDLAFAFSSHSESSDVVELSIQEKQETKGEWVVQAVGALAGAYVGGTTYAISGGNEIGSGFFGSMAAGALTGALTPAVTIPNAARGITGAVGGALLNRLFE